MPCPAFRSAVAVVSAPIHPGERQSPDWRTTPRIRITSSWLFAVDLVAAAFSYFVRPQRTKYRRADFDLRREAAAKNAADHPLIAPPALPWPSPAPRDNKASTQTKSQTRSRPRASPQISTYSLLPPAESATT